MRAGDALRPLVEIAIPALLVAASVMLLAAAVGATLLGADRATQWELFGEGIACWVAGIAWGLLVNDRASWLRRPW